MSGVYVRNRNLSSLEYFNTAVSIRNDVTRLVASSAVPKSLKKQAALVAKGIMTVEQVNQSYQSWRGSMQRLCAHETVKRMDALYKELFG